MNEQYPPYLSLTRRLFLRACVAGTGVLAFGHPPWLPALIPAKTAVAKAQEPYGRTDRASAWQSLHEHDDKTVQFILRHGLAPLFGLPPAATRHIASTTQLENRTWRDRFYPPKFVDNVWLDPAEEEELRNLMPGDLFGRWTKDERFIAFDEAEMPMELTIEGKRIVAAPIAQVSGPCTLDHLFFVQQPPWHLPDRLQHLEVILHIDGAWHRFEGNDFFTRWYPFAENIASSDGNTCTLPIGAKHELSLYMRSTAERYSRQDKRYITPLSGWFAALFSRYEHNKQDAIVAYTPQNAAVYETTAALVKEAVEELGYTPYPEVSGETAFEWAARKVYGPAHCTTNARPVTLTPTSPLAIPTTEGAIMVGLRVTIPKAQLSSLDKIILDFVYPDGRVITFPARYLFGVFQSNPVDVIRPNEHTHLYETLHTGIKQQDDEVILYANLPLVGLAEIIFHTEAAEPLTFHLEYDTVPRAALPASFQGKKFFPWYCDVVSGGHDHIIAPPTVTPGVAVGAYLFEVDWQHRADDDAPSPFTLKADGKPSNWKFFYLEYNSTIFRFVEDGSGQVSPEYSGSFLGWEDWFTSFYIGGPRDSTEESRNMRKGSPIHGRFLSARFDQEKNEFEGGVCFFAPIGLSGQALVLPQYGYNRKDDNPLITHAHLRTLALCYLDEEEDPDWSISYLFAKLEMEEPELDLPLAHLADLTIRYNLKRIANVPEGERTPAARAYLEKAQQFYREIAEWLEHAPPSNPTGHLTHDLRRVMQEAFERILGEVG